MTTADTMRRRLALYGLIDPERSTDRDLGTLAREAIAGGVTLLQYRDKHAPDAVMRARAGSIRDAISGTGVPFLINDRVGIALDIGADGVHLGQDDMAPAEARRLLGPGAIVGLSVKTVAQAEAAPLDILDYVCIGGVFATMSKDNPDPPVGEAGFAAIRAAIAARDAGFPVGAIAGIDAGNAAGVIAAGADGVAIISALFAAEDVNAAARELRGVVDAALQARAAA